MVESGNDGHNEGDEEQAGQTNKTEKKRSTNNKNPPKIDTPKVAGHKSIKYPARLLTKALESFSEHETKAQAREEFERRFVKPLEELSRASENGKQNIFHIMAKSKPATPQQKGFLHWMLRQSGHEHLLMLEDGAGLTPMHYVHENHEFVNEVMHVEGLSIIDILGKRSGSDTGTNCLQRAIQNAFPNLSYMIEKCATNKDMFICKVESPEDTPLHIAVQKVLIPIRDDGEGPESDNGTDQYEDNEDQQSQQGLEDGQHPDGNHNVVNGVNLTSDLDQDSNRDLEESDDIYAQNSEPLGYRLERKEEQRERLSLILSLLDSDQGITRPRPPSRPLHTETDVLQHEEIEDSQQIHQQREDSSPDSRITGVQDIGELLMDHSVRLLVKACPKALSCKNKHGRTPYQEREHVLLNNKNVKDLVNEYAKKEGRRGDTKQTREARAKRAIVVQDPIAHYIRSYCMRNSGSREETMKRLYKPGQECRIEFDLTGFPTPIITHEYLEQLERLLKFETILKYVALPVLSVEAPPAKGPKSQKSKPSKTDPELRRNGRSDLVAIFGWLWSRGVREIIRVMVFDDGLLPHANASIVEALYGFKVEVWDWKRVDLCSDVIHESSPCVTEVSLYSSGNNAVLMGWASSEGLGNRAKFPQLKLVNIFAQDGLEDQTRRDQDKAACRAGIINHGGKTADGDNLIDVKVKLSSESSTTESKEADPPWIKSIRNYSTFILNASRMPGNEQVQPVKIAIIDDGIDATMYDFQSKIAGGETFCPYPHSLDLVNSYFVPRGMHGTRIAQLICSICPVVELYIARLEELPAPGSGRCVTAKSAAKAVSWAVSCGVDIISMSWTIRTNNAQNNPDITSVREAIEKAHADDILMFCSASDQGANNKDEYFPGGWNQCFHIGAATFNGDKLTWVDDKVNFFFPGRNVPFISKDKSITYESGSSIATAAATGLAGLLIYSARLYGGISVVNNKEDPFHQRLRMSNAFTKAVREGKFPPTDEFLNRMFKSKIQQATPTTNTQNLPTNIGIEELDWNKVFRSNPRAVSSMGDCLGQMAAKRLLRAISHQYIHRKTRNGPFYLQLTDLHASNIFVSKHGNITCLIDHEWICALPAEMLSVPYWLTGCAIDGITNKKLDEFEIVHREFMKIFEEEEVKMMPTNPPAITPIIHDGWKSGAVWFWHCITSVNAAWSLVKDHIGPRFLPLSTDSERIYHSIGVRVLFWLLGERSLSRKNMQNSYEFPLTKRQSSLQRKRLMAKFIF